MSGGSGLVFCGTTTGGRPYPPGALGWLRICACAGPAAGKARAKAIWPASAKMSSSDLVFFAVAKPDGLTVRPSTACAGQLPYVKKSRRHNHSF